LRPTNSVFDELAKKIGDGGASEVAEDHAAGRIFHRDNGETGNHRAVARQISEAIITEEDTEILEISEILPVRSAPTPGRP
jgi:hypothetical protein